MKMTRWMPVIAALLLAQPFAARSQTQIPAAINYQGKLTDQNGNALSSGYYVVEFRIWKDPTLTGAAELAWGRSFPIHVISGGIFNVLLTNDGATNSDGGNGDILAAFGESGRYLGLTVTQRPQGTVQNPSEIKPRQQLVSAPYTIQAQTANSVAAGGVMNSSLAANSVTTDKIAAGNVTSGTIANNAVITAKLADSAVTTAKIGDGAVTTAKIADGAVTAAKLNIEGDVRLNDHALLLSTDTSSGLKRFTNYNGFPPRDAAVLYGAEGGFITTTRSNTAVLSWASDAVGMEGRLDAYGSLVNLSGYVNAVTNTPEFTAQADGMMMFYGRRGNAVLQIWNNGVKLFAEGSTYKGMPFFYNESGSDGRSVMWPIRKGDKFQWSVGVYDTGSSYDPINNYLFFLPLGKNQGNNSVSH